MQRAPGLLPGCRRARALRIVGSERSARRGHLPLCVSTPNAHPSLSAEEVRRIARLARLEISDAEAEEYRASLSAVVGYMSRLRDVDLSGVEPLAHIGDTHTRLDEDVPSSSLSNDALMKLAPDRWEGFVKVPKVLDDGGGA